MTTGCATIGWYAQAARGQMEILSKREDIAEILSDPATEPETARQLTRVLKIRNFATTELGLPDNPSYTQYADLGRDAALWNVVAAPRYSLEPKTWCYPIAGCVSYRGYFRQQRARALADRLARDGWDVAVVPVTAYSTLGRLNDPVLNTMLAWDEPRLAGIIFHELAHQKIWVQGETAFNEAYATFVEQEGVRRWLAANGDEEAIARWDRSRAMAREFRELVLSTRERLATVYEKDLDSGAMEAARASGFEALQQDYAVFRDRWSDFRYDGWMNQPLNNAHLAGFATYEAGVDAFAELHEALDGNLIDFHHQVGKLAEADRDSREKFLRRAD